MGLGVLPTVQANKLACYIFVDVGRRHKTPGSETKGLVVTDSKAWACCWFVSIPHATQIPWGNIGGLRWMTTYMMGGVARRKHWTWEIHHIYSKWKQACSLWEKLTSSLKLLSVNNLEKYLKQRSVRALNSWHFRKNMQGTWQISPQHIVKIL